MSNSSTDHYTVLGVLPEAEPVVITAAYRALAQRYHPDRWQGTSVDAHSRMSEINAAYAILSDPELRAKYNQSRDKRSHAGYEKAEEANAPFDEALDETAERWAVARELYPDLDSLRESLQRVSSSLALAFTSILLETRRFKDRSEIAAKLEQSFLERYFSSDPELVKFARSLINANQKEALRALNSLIDVVGPNEQSSVLVAHIDRKFDLAPLWQRLQTEEKNSVRLKALIQRVKYSSDYEHARDLAVLLGYEITEVGKGLFQPTEVVIRRPPHQEVRLRNRATFVVWAKDELCR